MLEQLKEAQQNGKLSERSPWQDIKRESQRARQKDKILDEEFGLHPETLGRGEVGEGPLRILT